MEHGGLCDGQLEVGRQGASGARLGEGKGEEEEQGQRDSHCCGTADVQGYVAMREELHG